MKVSVALEIFRDYQRANLKHRTVLGYKYVLTNFHEFFGERDLSSVSGEDIYHFLVSLIYNAQMNLHITKIYGEDDHHIAEAAFKALALALKDAIRFDDIRSDIPSTKGVL